MTAHTDGHNGFLVRTHFIGTRSIWRCQTLQYTVHIKPFASLSPCNAVQGRGRFTHASRRGEDPSVQTPPTSEGPPPTSEVSRTLALNGANGSPVVRGHQRVTPVVLAQTWLLTWALFQRFFGGFRRQRREELRIKGSSYIFIGRLALGSLLRSW